MDRDAGVRQNRAQTREPNFIDSYLHYIGHSESPTTFQRWSIITALSAWLGKRFYLKHGHSQINSNMYVMLMGAAGTRKSTAIKVASKLLKKAGYSTFSSSKCSKEQFLVDLAATGQKDTGDGYDSILDKNLKELSQALNNKEISYAIISAQNCSGYRNAERLNI